MKIGSYTMVAMEGEFSGYGDGIEEINRPGLDGHTFRKVGKRGRIFSIQTKSTHSSKSLAKKRIKDYDAMQGTFVNAEDANDKSYPKLMIHSVSSRLIPIGGATNNHDYMILTSWQLQRAGE